MTIPTGAKALEGGITPADLSFLTGLHQTNVNLSSSDFDTFGTPLDNLSSTIMNPSFTTSIESALPEKNNNSDSVFSIFPNLSLNTSDLNISTAVELKVIFCTEGAGYKNTFGYYFFLKDTNTILTNSDDNQDNNQGYFKPTVVFPNASLRRQGGKLHPGDTRILRGNRTDGQFENVSIGFFVIPNGYHSFSQTVTSGKGYVVHSTHTMNSNYDSVGLTTDLSLALADATTQQEIDDINDTFAQDSRTGIQMVMFDYDSKKVLCVEDIQRPGGDSDFNDLIIQISASPSLPQDSEQLVQINSLSLVQYDANGIFVFIPKSQLPTDGSSIQFKRIMTFKNDNVSFVQNNQQITKSMRNYTYQNILPFLNFNYSHQFIKEGSLGIKHTHTFTQTDYEDSEQTNDFVKLYILQSVYNMNDEILVDAYNTQFQVLLYYQTIIADLLFEPVNSYISTELYTLNNNGGVLASSVKMTSSTVSNLAWGDPHINTLDNCHFKFPNEITGNVILLKNKFISFTAEIYKCQHSNMTFFKSFTVRYKDINKVKIQVYPELKIEECSGNVLVFNTPTERLIHAIKDDHLKKIASDPTCQCLSIKISNTIRATFIDLPHYPNIRSVTCWDVIPFKVLNQQDTCFGFMNPN
jgi:hypothetical protein